MSQPQNPNPIVKEVQERTFRRPKGNLDREEVFDIIRDIEDPEYPYTLEQLNVVSEEQVNFDLEARKCAVKFTPTVPHCSMSTLIGLMIKIKLERNLPKIIKIQVGIEPGTHNNDKEITKQLNDKERVAAAKENSYLMEVIESKLGC